MKNKVMWMFVIAILLVIILAGCTEPDNRTETEEPAVSIEAAENTEKPTATEESSASDYSYADEILDNILAGIKNRDYAKFSLDFSDSVKNAIPEDRFIAICDLFDSTIGEYQSRTFAGAEKVDNDENTLIYIVYTAEYTDEPDGVIITIAFSGEKCTKKVETLLFNSPKLRQR